MKLVKVKKKYLTDLPFMYKDLGLVKDNQCDPSKVFMSLEDLTELRKSIKKQFKKEYPYLNARRIEASVAMYLMNLEPNASLAKVLKKGHLVILD